MNHASLQKPLHVSEYFLSLILHSKNVQVNLPKYAGYFLPEMCM